MIGEYISPFTRHKAIVFCFALFVLPLFVMADSERKAVAGDVEDNTLEQMGYQPGKLILFGLNHREFVQCCKVDVRQS